jgi:hypothetical protein
LTVQRNFAFVHGKVGLTLIWETAQILEEDALFLFMMQLRKVLVGVVLTRLCGEP